VFVDVVSIALRTLGLATLLQAAGVAIFIALFRNTGFQTTFALKRWVRLCAAIALPALLVQYLLEAARMAGELSGVMDVDLQMLALHSSTSIALALRLTGLLIILAGLRRATNSVLLIGAFIALLSFIFTGHTSTHSSRGLLALLLLIHLHAIAFWFGALPALHLISVRESLTQTAAVVEKFSSLALWIVPCIFIAGLVISIQLLPNIAALGSDYGRFLIAKVSGFSLLMGLAAWNKWRLTPAIARDEHDAAISLRRSMLAEFVLILAVIAVTVTMTTLSSPEM
jgi:putative copper resistance protein D